MEFYHFFSFSAKKAIYRSSEVCAQFNCQYLEPEHILYSILNLRSCSAIHVLAILNINLPKLNYSVEQYLYENAGSFQGTASFSARTLNLLDNSFKEVKRLHHKEIGTCHLLVALAGDRSSFLRELFADHRLDGSKIRDTYMTHLKGFSQSAAAPEAVSPAVSSAGYSQEESSQVAAERAIEDQMFDMRLREVLWLAGYLAKRLRHEEMDPAHVMYALSTREDGLKLIEEAYKLKPLKPSSVLVALAGEMDKLPLTADVSKLVPHGKLVRTALTRAFQQALDQGEMNIRFDHFSEVFLKAAKPKFNKLLGGCVIKPGEMPAPGSDPDEDPDGAGSAAGVPA